MDTSKIIDLATCSFIERKENVLLVGRSGVGKSHIAQVLGQRACRAGYNAIYISAHDMLTQLRAARADATHERRMLRFTSPELLIMDDLGLRPLVSDEPITSTRSSASDTSTAPPSSPRTGRSKSGPRSSETSCSPAPRWTACCTTPT